jgi:hypothetical protein
MYAYMATERSAETMENSQHSMRPSPNEATQSRAAISHPRHTYHTKLNSVALFRERTIATERPPLVGEVSANFCG